MVRSPIYIDITELVKNPLRTGIQRVEREIINNWDGPNSLVPCIYHSERQEFLEVTSSTLHSTMEGEGVCERIKTHLNDCFSCAQVIPTAHLKASLFNPEVFFDPMRSQKYIELSEGKDVRLSWLVYDFMPFLYPEHYPVGTPLHCMPYLLAMRHIPQLAFISNQTRCEFNTKILRKPRRGAPVFALGGDGLRIEKQIFSPDRRSFAYFGTIEPRKNVGAILRAFTALWERGENTELFIIGRMDSRAQQELFLIDHLQAEGRFHYLGHASDAAIRNVLGQTRATIFVSSEEGFGIPPFESLAAGIPVITSATLPSVNDLPEGGYLKIAPVSPATIGAAVEYLSVDANAARLWEEAGKLPIPTWRDFVSHLSDWLHYF